MEAKELRLSNLVYEYLESFPNMKEIRVVDTVTISLINGELKPKTTQLLHAPIPLTEEWLLRFGFDIKIGRHGEYYQHETKVYFRVWRNEGGFWNVGRKDPESKNKCYNTYWIKLDIQFVHKFQNIFYETTNEELTLKNVKPSPGIRTISF